MKHLFIINGSASGKSSNQKLIAHLTGLLQYDFSFTVFDSLKTLPHFDPELSIENTPQQIVDLRQQIEAADAAVICTPEYVFSIPSGLKNLIEWCVSGTMFSDKPTALITASTNGEKGHAELQLIMETLTAKTDPGTSLLISGIKGKFNEHGELIDEELKQHLIRLAGNLKQILDVE